MQSATELQNLQCIDRLLALPDGIMLMLHDACICEDLVKAHMLFKIFTPDYIQYVFCIPSYSYLVAIKNNFSGTIMRLSLSFCNNVIFLQCHISSIQSITISPASVTSFTAKVPTTSQVCLMAERSGKRPPGARKVSNSKKTKLWTILRGRERR